MLKELKETLDSQISSLDHELRIELPREIKKALEWGDLRENSEYKAALERQGFVQARLNHLTGRMNEISQIDVDVLPYDRVGFGSRVNVHDMELDEVMSLTIVAGDFMDLDAGHISMASPIGQGLLGARLDQEVTVQLPMGERRFKVLELVTLPQQLDGKSGG